MQFIFFHPRISQTHSNLTFFIATLKDLHSEAHTSTVNTHCFMCALLNLLSHHFAHLPLTLFKACKGLSAVHCYVFSPPSGRILHPQFLSSDLCCTLIRMQSPYHWIHWLGASHSLSIRNPRILPQPASPHWIRMIYLATFISLM